MGSIDVRKGVANWQHPSQRNACGNCQHVKREADRRDVGRVSWNCTKLHIYTLAFGLCDHWEAMK